jgi:glycosyltransferase involved in cell wall biosynthesis
MEISIITAVYNREYSIKRALESIKKQTYPYIQNVVIDGCSTDNTAVIAKKILCKSDIFKSEQDSGIYEALNKGIKFSSGEVIGFLHSDDYYQDHTIVQKIMQLFSNPEVDIVYGNSIFFEKDNQETDKRIYKSDKLSKRNLAWGKMPSHPTMFIRRRVYDKVGLYNIDFKIAADYEFLCRLTKRFDFNAIYLDRTFLRMQLGGISTKGFRNTILLNLEVMKGIKQNGIYTNLFMVLSKYPRKILQLLKK